MSILWEMIFIRVFKPCSESCLVVMWPDVYVECMDWFLHWWSVSFFTVFCKSNANEIRRISVFVLAISRRKYKWKFDRKFEAFFLHFVWTGRFFVEISWRSENSRWKASFRSILFGSSLRTDNRLLRTTKFVYPSCNEHRISPNVFPNFSFTKTRYDIFDTKHRKQKN